MTHQKPKRLKKVTCLDGVGADIGKDGLELLGDKGSGDRMDAIDSNSVL